MLQIVARPVFRGYPDQVVTQLGPEQRIPLRPFTSVELYEGDHRLLASMIGDLRTLLDEAAAGGREVLPHERVAWKDDGLRRRAILCDPGALMPEAELCAVGFLSERHPDVDIGPLEKANDEIVREFKKYPGVLSYSSYELPASNWANLVLHDEPDVTERWRGGQVHARAVENLSPLHYRNVRIHNCRLPDGLTGEIFIERTKYFDYEEAGDVWRAVRELPTTS